MGCRLDTPESLNLACYNLIHTDSVSFARFEHGLCKTWCSGMCPPQHVTISPSSLSFSRKPLLSFSGKRHCWRLMPSALIPCTASKKKTSLLYFTFWLCLSAFMLTKRWTHCVWLKSPGSVHQSMMQAGKLGCSLTGLIIKRSDRIVWGLWGRIFWD